MKQNFKKVSRNEVCPCGSGQKYKRCHGDEIKMRMLEEGFRHADAQAKIHALEDEKRKALYGSLRPIIHATVNDQKIVAVGNQLYFSKKWKTFPDFLGDYIRETIGPDWSKEEVKRPLALRHPIMKIYDKLRSKMLAAREGAQEILPIEPSGVVAYWFRMAYDLYALRHHQSLQEKVLHRLRDPNQFQGARYELFVTAAFLRAGFDIEFEDETDSTQTHPEFVATHRKLGTRVSVEAKSRHRDGVLDHKINIVKETSDDRVKVKPILMKALKKKPKHPYFIFVDVNLPNASVPIQFMPWFKEVTDTLDHIKNKVWKDGPFPASAVIFTNDPSHYDWDGVGANYWAFGKEFEDALHSGYPKEVLNSVIESLGKSGNIPQEFPE